MGDPRVDIVIGAKTAEFAGKLQEAKGLLNEFVPPGFSQALTSPIAAATAGLAGLVKVFDDIIARAERVERIAARADVSRRQAAAIDRAARYTGISPEQVGNYMVQLRRSTGEALAGSKTDLAAFNALGITQQDLAGSDPMAILKRIVTLFNDGSYSARQFAAANQLLGRSFSELLPAIKKGFADELGTGGGSDLASWRGAMANDRIDLSKKLLSKLYDKTLDTASNNFLDPLRLFARPLLGDMGSRLLGFGFDKIASARMNAEEAKEDSQRKQRLDDQLRDLRNQGVAGSEMLGPPIPTVAKRPSLIGSSDALSRIGLFRGGAADSTNRTLQQQLQELRSIVSELRTQTHLATSE
jgi:hypothetical protein